MYNYSSSELPPWYNDRTSVTGIVIEEGITSIGTNAFYGTYAVTVDIPSTVKLIDDYAFEYSEALKSIVIPVGVETIGDYAFHVCSALEEVSLPDSLTTMEHAAFETCRALREITIPKNLKVVEWVTFHNCSGLTKVTIEEGVTTLNSNAFAGCTNLQTVYIPSTITTIDQIPFNYSTAIKDVYYNGSKTAWNNLGIQVPSTAVIHCTEYAISVGAAEKGTVSVDKTKAAEGDVITVTAEPAENYTLAAIYVDGKEINGNTFTVSDNHTVTAEFVMKGLVDSGECGENATWTLCDTDDDGTGDQLVISGSGAMYDFASYESEGVTTPPWSAYRENIKSVVIESGITHIGRYAFYSEEENYAVESVSIADTV